MKHFFKGRKAIFSVLFLFLFSVGANAQPHGGGSRDTRFLSAEGATEVLNNFRNQRVLGDYAMRFILEKTDIKGTKTSLFGNMWGGRRDDSNVIRLDIPKQKTFSGLELLVYGGKDAKAWMIPGEGKLETLDETKYSKPIVEEFVFTPFHILMPFIYWNDSTYTGGTKVKGRKVQIFELKPPKDYSADISMVRIYLDDVYNALIKAEIFAKDGSMETELTVSTIKKIQEQWIAKKIDLIDSKRKDKLSFQVKQAALNLDIENSIFQSENLRKLYPQIPLEAFSDL